MAIVSDDIFEEISPTGDIFDKIKVSVSPSLTEKATKKFRPGAGGKALLRGLSKAAQSVQEMGPLGAFGARGPIPKKAQEQLLEELLGDPEAGFLEKTIERGAEIAPYLVGGEGALIPKLGRAGLSALLGQATEEVGGGELAQTGAEILGLGLPALRKKIIPSKGQKKVLEMLRRKGLTEKQIAPLIPTERKSALLSKVGSRNFRTEKAARRTKDSLGNLYSQMAKEGENLPILSSNRSSLLKSELNEKLQKMPSNVRRAIQEDLDDLFRRPVKANDLMNFWQDINSQINWKSFGGGKNRLNSLKSTLLEGIKDISPELASDFELTNKQFIKFNKLYKNLKPQSLDRLIALGEAGAFIGSLMKFGVKGAATVVATDVARKGVSEMLINPRLQNLTRQIVSALNKNKIAIAKKIQEQIKKELKKGGIDLSIAPVSDNLPKSSPSQPK